MPLSRERTRRAVHPSAAAVVHHRLRDPRLGNRIRRRAAGQLPAVGRGGPRDGAGHQVVSGAAGDPAGAQRAAGGRPPSRGLHRPVAARAAAARRPDASADVVLAESVSMAMLVLLETLTPDERAVFVLREVFGFDYDEIAGAVGKSVGDGAPDRAPRPRACAGAAQAVRARRLRSGRQRSRSSS